MKKNVKPRFASYTLVEYGTVSDPKIILEIDNIICALQRYYMENKPLPHGSLSEYIPKTVEISTAKMDEDEYSILVTLESGSKVRHFAMFFKNE